MLDQIKGSLNKDLEALKNQFKQHKLESQTKDSEQDQQLAKLQERIVKNEKDLSLSLEALKKQEKFDYQELRDQIELLRQEHESLKSEVTQELNSLE